MKIKQVITGKLEENCYVLTKEKMCLVIDPGDELEKIKMAMGENKLLAVLLTHAHFDHIGALRDLVRRNTPIYKYSNCKDTHYEIGPFSFMVIKTPGHSKDSLTFYFEEIASLFTGDCLFKETIGRVDLPGGNEAEMQTSLSLLKSYPDKTKVYPGHGDSTDMGYEKKHNPFLLEMRN